jgi:Co/Zn/Cd efflux system component
MYMQEQKILLKATILAFVFMIFEIIGGYMSQRWGSSMAARAPGCDALTFISMTG